VENRDIRVDGTAGIETAAPTSSPAAHQENKQEQTERRRYADTGAKQDQFLLGPLRSARSERRLGLIALLGLLVLGDGLRDRAAAAVVFRYRIGAAARTGDGDGWADELTL
jgi:hypothetical protein